MKTTLVAIALSALAFSASAQMTTVGTGTTEPAELKPGAGAKNLELQFAPLGGSPISISGIRYRYFTTPTMAYRANVFLGVSRTSEPTTADPDFDETNLSIDVAVRPGIERHFSGTRRLSPYVGLEADLAYRYVRQTTEFDGGESVTTGDGGFFRIGANAVAGFDFYVSQHIYLGAELGFGLGVKFNSAVSTESDGETTDGPDGAVEFNLGPNVVSGIRLGYIF